ncbi:SDR family NAD(P)-dependent oxidoreductase [Caulobacter segnis]
MVHHWHIQGFRPHLGASGSFSRRPGRRHGAGHQNAAAAGRGLRRSRPAATLNVDDKAAVDTSVADAVDRFGRIDVAINNAGYGLFGAIEEVSEAEARAQMETNFFGALWTTQAVLPHMRQQGSGHIIQVSSIGGVNAFATLGLYHASKWALEGFSQSLAAEVAALGIKVTIVEPAGYATDWSGPSARRATPIEAYNPVREARAKFRQRCGSWRSCGQRPGDPQARSMQPSRRCGCSSARPGSR